MHRIDTPGRDITECVLAPEGSVLTRRDLAPDRGCSVCVVMWFRVAGFIGLFPPLDTFGRLARLLAPQKQPFNYSTCLLDRQLTNAPQMPPACRL